MRTTITKIFAMLLVLTLLTSFIVGIAWLFDSEPTNLYLVWKFLGSSLAVSFLFQLLLGGKIEWK